MTAFLDLENNSRAYKMKKREKDFSCTFCPPHRNENEHWTKPRKKKAFEIRRMRQKRQSYIIKEFS